MYKPDIRFSDPEYAGLEHELGDLSSKLVVIVNDAAFNKRGKSALQNPSDIEITPLAIDEPKLIVRSWHETSAPAGKEGILQINETILSLEPFGEETMLTTEDQASYLLTTSEAMLMISVGGAALISSAMSTPNRVA
jgi:hypothetical protein